MIIWISGLGSLFSRYAGKTSGEKGENLRLSHGTSPKQGIHILGKALIRLISPSPPGLRSLSVFLLLLFPVISYAAEVTIAWSPSTDPKVLGYRVYYGPSGQENEFQADARTETKITLKNLREGGTYSFSVITYDSAGRENRYSHKTTVLNLKDRDTHFVSIIPPSPPTPLVTPGPPVQEKILPDASPGCEFVILPASQSIGSAGGTLSVAISTKLNCSWTAVTNAPWVIITSNDSGSGSQPVYLLVKANVSASSREGTLTVAGQTLKVTQAGRARHTLNVVTTGTGTGTVTSTPAGIDFEAGTVVTLTAAPGANSDFAGWSGQCSGRSPTCIFAINASTTVNTIFKLKTFVISAGAGANGSITPSGRVVVNHGGSQKFTFKPNKGHQIGQIKVDGVSVGKTETLYLGNIVRPHKVDATFIPLR
jgi:hypothetical protein